MLDLISEINSFMTEFEVSKKLIEVIKYEC